MTAFPYPVRTFACRSYDEDMQEDLQEFDKFFFNGLCAYAGPVVGETGIPGLKIDFRAGLRLEVPEGLFHVRISDGETGEMFLDEDVSGQLLVSMEKYWIPWHVEVLQGGAPVFAHDFDVRGQDVCLSVLSTSLGDMLATLPSVLAFQETSGARVTFGVPESYASFVQFLCPSLPLVKRLPDDAYAAFYLSCGNGDPHQSPVDGRRIPLASIAHVILGLEGRPPAPPPVIRARLLAGPRPIAEPYVCIGVQASSALKSWLWPGGWDEVVAALLEAGYRVLCIDQHPGQSDHGFTVRMPEGTEDFTGDRPLAERAQLLAHADFFVGLGSGLAWVAWLVGCPVVMIAGFSMPWYEFPEAERVWNPRVCHGCFNETKNSFLHTPCPHYGEASPRFMECQRRIPPAMVLRAIARVQQRIADRRESAGRRRP